MSNKSEPEMTSSDYPLDSEATLDEHESGRQKSASRDTSSPGSLTASGLPYQEGLIGRTLGSGVIKEHIGSGGMGDVYKIWNERLEKFRAVKLLKHGSDKLLEKRFEREIKITAAFDHPNIVRVIDAQRWKGYLYLEMEYVKGCALDEILQKYGCLPPVVCIAIGILIARALHYAHNLTYTIDGRSYTGVIHRDLKPSNIMLADDGALKLMDFGIARPVGGELATLTMGVVGSWVYLPPEQLDGCGVDFRADIYTMGEVLYELLTGKTAFSFNNQREFCDCKSRGRYPPIDTGGGKIPGVLVGIVDKCLKVNPAARFQSALELETVLTDLFGRSSERTPEQVVTSFVHDETVEDSTDTVINKYRRPADLQQKVPVHQRILKCPQLLKCMNRRLLELYTGFAGHVRKAIRLRLPTPVLPMLRNNRKAVIGAGVGLAGVAVITGIIIMQQHPSRTETIAATTTLTRTVPVVTSSPPTPTPAVIPVHAPRIVRPASGDTVSADTVFYIWNPAASAQGYALHLSTTPNFTDTVVYQTAIIDTIFAVTGVERFEALYWHVGTVDSMNTIAWTPPSITFIRMPPPGIPVPVSPPDGKKRCLLPVDFSWENVSGAESYRLQIASDIGFIRCVVDTGGIWPEVFTSTSLTAGIDYYWHVRAEKGKIAGDWSPVITFSVADTETATDTIDIVKKPSKDYGVIASAAIRKNNLSQAEIAIANLNRRDPRMDTLKCRLTDMYIIAGNVKKASFYLNSITLKDLFTEVLRGKLLLLQKNYRGAYSVFEDAAKMKTVFNRKQVQAEVIYYRAVAAQQQYNTDKSENARSRAIGAWKEVWRLYKDRPTHTRFKIAVREGSRLAEAE